MLQVLNLQDFQPNFSRKTSESLAIASLGDIDVLECCSVLHIDSKVKQCRICLQSNEDSHHVFISPCKCIGSLKFVHQICYMTWMERLFSLKSSKEQRKIKDEGLQCEICKQKNYLTMQLHRKCLTCKQINQKIKKNLASFILFTLLLIFILGALALIIYFMQATSVSSFGRQLIPTGVISCIFIFLFIMEIVLAYTLVINFFMEGKIKLLSFASQKKGKSKKTKRVFPL